MSHLLIKCYPVLVLCCLLAACGTQLFSQTGGAIKVIKIEGKATSSMSNSGILANQTLYVAGQDGRNADGSLPKDFQQEVSQSLSSVQAVLRAAGMDFGNVVWMNVYLTHMSNMDAMNNAYWKMIGSNPPARTILGVAELPNGESIEINCIAASNAVKRVVIHPQGWPQGVHIDPAGIQADDVLYMSGQSGVDPMTGKLPSDYSGEVKQALDNVATIAKAANMSMANVVWVNPYWTSTGNPADSREMSKIYATYFEFGNTPGRGTRQMAELPNKTRIVFSCIAGADLAKRKAIRPVNEVPSATASPGVIYGDTYYMSGKNAFVPALGLFTPDLILQFRYVIRNLLDDLQAADMDFSNVVSSTLYMREMKDTDQVEPLYRTFFKDHLPAQALLENNLDLKSESAVEMSLIAVRQPKK
jgi:enamine deaminase RidA (YjgF/YER057c/UK114 family)